MKTRILEHLGQDAFLLPGLVAEALAANDRAKLRMSVLQAAMAHARQAEGRPVDLSAESRAAGIAPEPIDVLLASATATSDGVLAATGLGELCRALAADLEAMIRAVEAGDPAAGSVARRRVSEFPALAAPTDAIPMADILRLTSIAGDATDTLHRLVMDLHRSINGLAAECAEEIVAGARASGLTSEDRTAVAAFMRGLDRTRALKFDHPGLDTMAIRSGSRLLIQNDIGTTDAHVLVVAVEGRSTTITYTDVHRERAEFFTRLLAGNGVRWGGLEREENQRLAREGEFFLVTGRQEAASDEECHRLLQATGAAIVFLIDWNKARKQLQMLVPGSAAIAILEDAARRGIGHRAFLELGGRELVAAAVRHAAPGRIGFGDQLAAILGRDSTIDFLRSVLRIATESLGSGRSPRVARDLIEAELVRHLEGSDKILLHAAIQQTGLARDLASAIHRQLADRLVGRTAATRLTERARHVEEKADRLIVEIRSSMARSDSSRNLVALANWLEEAIDELEQAAFMASLLPGGTEAALLRPVADLASTAVAAAEAVASGLDATMEIPQGRRADADDALAALARLVALEHAADAHERAATAAVLGSAPRVTEALAILELTRAIERATDRLAAAGHVLHAHVMRDLAA